MAVAEPAGPAPTTRTSKRSMYAIVTVERNVAEERDRSRAVPGGRSPGVDGETEVKEAGNPGFLPEQAPRQLGATLLRERKSHSHSSRPCRGEDSNLRRLSQRVYSPPPLATREPLRGGQL